MDTENYYQKAFLELNEEEKQIVLNDLNSRGIETFWDGKVLKIKYPIKKKDND